MGGVDEVGELMIHLSKVTVYQRAGNPTETEKTLAIKERRALIAMLMGIILLFGGMPLQGGSLITDVALPGVVMLCGSLVFLCGGVAYLSADWRVMRHRGAFRTQDEAHHNRARATMRAGQITALAVYSDWILEETEDEFRSRLSTGLNRLGSIIGEKTSVVATALAMFGGYKLLSEAHLGGTSPWWVSAYIGAGIIVALTPAFVRASPSASSISVICLHLPASAEFGRPRAQTTSRSTDCGCFEAGPPMTQKRRSPNARAML